MCLARRRQDGELRQQRLAVEAAAQKLQRGQKVAEEESPAGGPHGRARLEHLAR